jgi:flavin reductase (DIM6/NTAB) family NADH-FMN oxidoreductase RutF
MPDVSADDFKGALGSWAAGVTVVTTRHENLVYGLTVSSFSSLSLEPRLIMVCFANSNRIVEMVRESKVFAVSILSEGQSEISNWFSRSGREPVEAFEEFSTIEWHTGSPIIAGAVAHLDCALDSLVPAGDHTIGIGSVIGASYDASLLPLMYYRRGYRKLVMD